MLAVQRRTPVGTGDPLSGVKSDEEVGTPLTDPTELKGGERTVGRMSREETGQGITQR